ncbi:unnamed protein product, partial [Allacma fusca]
PLISLQISRPGKISSCDRRKMDTWRHLLIVFCVAVALIKPLASSPTVTPYEDSDFQENMWDSTEIETERHLSESTFGNVNETTEGRQVPSEIESSTAPSIPETTAATEEPTTTTTTTTTPKPLPQYEIQTNSLISQNNDSMNQLQLDLLRYETQLNLNTLDTILPILEVVRRNMSILLDTPHESYVDFETQSNTLENELLQLEGQINENRAIQQKYSQVEKDTRRQLEIVQKSLGSILKSQVQVLSPDAALTRASQFVRVVKSEDEIREFFTDFSEQPLEEGLYYLRSLATPPNRIQGYGLFLNILQNKGQNSPVFVNFVGDLFIYPELQPIQAHVPVLLKTIFTKTPMTLEMRSYRRQLTISSGAVVTRNLGRDSSSKSWVFYPVDNGRFYIILNSQLNQGIGVVDSTTSTPSDRYKRINVRALAEILNDEEYHWGVYPIARDGNISYELCQTFFTIYIQSVSCKHIGRFLVQFEHIWYSLLLISQERLKCYSSLWRNTTQELFLSISVLAMQWSNSHKSASQNIYRLKKLIEQDAETNDESEMQSRFPTFRRALLFKQKNKPLQRSHAKSIGLAWTGYRSHQCRL